MRLHLRTLMIAVALVAIVSAIGVYLARIEWDYAVLALLGTGRE
jgi:hypothetical protein